MTDSFDPRAFPLEAIQRLIEHFNNQGVVIGGVAVSFIGRPRSTADTDVLLLLSIDDLPQLLEFAEEEGIFPRIVEVEQFARRNRVVLLRHTKSGVNIDISLGFLPFEVETVERSEVRSVGSLNLRLPTPEDLIIMKAVAHRAKDMDDIAVLLAVHPTVDRKRVEFWVRQFADALDMPQIWTDLARLLRKAKK